jgi:predicted O-methyltransferase YrrM
MNAARASVLRDLIIQYDAKDIIEIGFYQGKSSLYIAAVLEDLGRGSLVTIDRQTALDHSPNIHDLLAETGLAHRVEPLLAYRSFTWELQKLIGQAPRPQFDLCYFDGGHTWDETGFGFLLIDLLLRPGGVIVFDDMNWTIAGSAAYKAKPAMLARYSDDEAEARNVERVWDLLVPERGYERVTRFPKLQWGVARKPG